MPRKQALLSLHQRLVVRRDALRKKLVQQFDSLHRDRDVGDVGDAASDGTTSELDSQLAAFESRELDQIERALELMRQGRYGICENCEEPIPVARLNAVPFAPLCVQCQRHLEEFGPNADCLAANWEHAYEFEGELDERELTLGDLEAGR